MTELRILNRSLFGRSSAFGRRFARLARVGEDMERQALRPHVSGRDMSVVAQRVFQGGMSGQLVVAPYTETARLIARIERLVTTFVDRNHANAVHLRDLTALHAQPADEKNPSTDPHPFF